MQVLTSIQTNKMYEQIELRNVDRHVINKGMCKLLYACKKKYDTKWKAVLAWDSNGRLEALAVSMTTWTLCSLAHTATFYFPKQQCATAKTERTENYLFSFIPHYISSTP